MVNPTNLWGSSDASSSIYSNDDEEAHIIYSSKPAIARKESTSAHSTTSSTVSRNPTIYSEDSIKSLGYRPFEYWKGPKPAAAPSAMKRPPPPLPPPRFTGTNPMKPINSLQDFKPLPKAKVLEVQSYMKDVVDPNPQPPSSPRVKDRYAARMAERARRKRERNQRIEEWPGWVPDEKVVLGQQELLRRQMRMDVATQREREASLAASQERWLKPRTWRRRVWGIVTTLGVLVLIAVIIVATTITQDNAPSLKTPLNVRVMDDHQRLVERTPEVEVEAFTSSEDAPLLSSSPSRATSSRRSSSLMISPAAARRMAHRFRRRHR